MSDLRSFLDKKADEYNRRSFIKDDPVCIPHQFSKREDIEIAAFFAATFSWGNRVTIINKSRELLQRRFVDGVGIRVLASEYGVRQGKLQKRLSAATARLRRMVKSEMSADN